LRKTFELKLFKPVRWCDTSVLWAMLFYLCAQFSCGIGLAQNAELSLFPDELESPTALLRKGIDNLEIQQYTLAHKYLKEAINRSKDQDSIRILILSLNNMGNLFYFLSNNDSALHYYYMALEAAETDHQYEHQNTIINNIGILYARTEQYEESREFFEKALTVSMLVNDTFKTAINLSNLGQVNLELEDKENAAKNLLLSQQYFLKLKDTKGLFSCYSSLGNLYLLDEDYALAEEYFLQALDLAHMDIHHLDRPSAYVNIGRVRVARKKHAEALLFLDTAWQLSAQHKQYEMAALALEWLTTTNKELNNFEEALLYAEKASNLKDSVIKKEKTDLLEESRMRYEFKVKSREYEILQKESETRKFLWRLILIALSIILILIFIILRIKLKTAIQRREQLAKENKLAQERLGQAHTKNKELKDQIETINYELMSKSLLIENKNQVLGSIGNLVEEAKASTELKSTQHLKELKQHLNRDNIMDKNLEDFRLYFERVHTDFFKNLHTTHPLLSSSDLRLAAFLLLQFNSKEIAEVLNITPGSVRKRKQRLREKMDLPKENDLLNYLFSFTR
jgi:tetratricopeptide (TPR) repeat protein